MLTLPSRRALFSALLTLGIAACAQPASSASTSADRPNRNVLTETDLPESGAESVYEVIQRLRPDYLIQRPSQSATAKVQSVAVFANGQLLGTTDDLRRIRAATVKSVRHYSIEEGKQHFGMQYGGGVIEITYKL